MINIAHMRNTPIYTFVSTLEHTRPSSIHSSYIFNNSASGSHPQFLLSLNLLTYTVSPALSSSFVYNAILMQTTVSDTMSHRVYLNEKTSLSRKQNSGRKAARNQHVRSCMFRIPWQSEFSPIELLKDLAERVTNALHFVSLRRSLHRDSSSLGTSKPAGAPDESYRTAAVEDCIEFIHSSFSRSNSLTATSSKDSKHTPSDTLNRRLS